MARKGCGRNMNLKNRGIMNRVWKFGSLLLVLAAWLGIPALQAQSYARLWKQVEQAQQKNLPQTVVKLTDEIYRKALEEKNSPQLLKAYLSREAYKQRLTPDSLYASLQYMEQWVAAETRPVDKAILHSLLADEYSNYWLGNAHELAGRTALDVDEAPADIRVWTGAQFVDRVMLHSRASLQDVERLLDTSTADYKPLIEQGDASAYYGHDLYHLLAKRAVSSLTFMDGTGADSLLQVGVEGIYRQMMDTYARRDDRRDAQLLCTLDYWKWKSSWSGGQEQEACLRALDELMERFADLPLCAEAYLRKAQWMRTGGEGRSVAEAIRLCDEAIRRYPSYSRIGNLKQLRAELLRPQVNLSATATAYPGDSLSFSVRYRTVQDPVTVNLYATSLDTYRSNLNLNSDKEFRRCSPRRVYTATHVLTPLPGVGKAEADVPYLPGDTTLLLPVPSEPGLYVVEVAPRGKNVRIVRGLLSVTRLRVLTLDLGDGRTEVLTLDGRSGHPVPQVTVDFYSGTDLTQARKLSTVVTGADGRTLVAWDKAIRCYVACKDDDTAMIPQNFYQNKGTREADATRYGLLLLTDRSIYRPGQTVCLKGVVYRQETDQAQALEGERFDLELLDANGKQVSTQQVSTGDFGSFVAEFALPSACLNGDFSIRARGKADASVSFRVEEYKRPTFEITFNPVTAPYCLGETVTLGGQVKSFSGATVQQMPLAYRVTRSMPYRFGAGRTLLADTVQLDADGRFSFSLELESEEALEAQGYGLYGSVTYEVEASVTDEAGETQTSTFSLTAGEQAFDLYIDLPSLFCKEDTVQWGISAFNGQQVRQRLEIDWRIDPEEGRAADGKPVLSGRCLAGVQHPLSVWAGVPSGSYRLTATATDSLGHRVEESTVFTLFSKADRRPPVSLPIFYYDGQLEVGVGQKASFYLGTSLQDAYVLMDIFAGGKRVESRVLQLTDTLMRMEVPYLESYGESASILFNTVRDGKLYSQQVYLKKKAPDTRLHLRWEVFRDRLLPGQQEEWRMVVSTPDGQPAAAEVLALMYDASLDKLYRNRPWWGVLFNRRTDWYYARLNNGGSLYLSPYFTVPDWKVPGWDYDRFSTPSMGSGAEGGVFFMTGNDVVVRGYSMSSNAVLAGNLKRAAVANGFELNETVVVNDADVSDLVFEEEMALSSELHEDVPQAAQPDGADLRTNFAETAFFYPQLRTNERGEVVLAFTAPQSLTRWNVRGYAHTRGMRTGTLEAQAVTAKEFMLRPNLPRFVRVGDLTGISATVSNLTGREVSGKVKLEVFDPATEKVLLTRREKFRAEAGRNAAVSFSFEADGRYSLLGVRLVADGGSFSDGEQHLLPVLSNEEYIVETLPLNVQGGETRVFPLDSLFNADSRTATGRRLTVEFTANPAWLAVQALPSLSLPTEENAVSWATAYYANELAGYILRTQPRIKAVFDAWQASGTSEQTLLSRLEQNQELKNILLNESPWVMEATDETEQMRRLGLLFDLNRQQNNRFAALTRLKELQGEDGAWGWYEGMSGSTYLTTYITGMLVRLSVLTGTPLEGDALQMKRKAFACLHKEAREAYLRLKKDGLKDYRLSDDILNYLYLLALDADEQPSADKEAYRYFLSCVPSLLDESWMQRQARAAVILLAAGRKAEAAEFGASMKEHLIREDEVGAHFAFNDGLYSLNMQPVSTHVAVMEALTRLGGNKDLVDDMKRWLLKQKQTTAWNSPVTTADAVYALLADGTALEARGDVRITLGKTVIETASDTAGTPAWQGLGYVKQTFTQGDAALKAGQVKVEKRDEGMAWGAVYAQYFTPMSDVRGQAGALGVEKQLYLEAVDASGRKSLKPLDAATAPRVGDKVVIRLVLRLDRAMDFLQLKDNRAACLEPTSALSGYRWYNGYGAYTDIKDASTRFYFDHLDKGTYVLEYACRIARSGRYEPGIAILQSAYAPEFASHSAALEQLVIE